MSDMRNDKSDRSDRSEAEARVVDLATLAQAAAERGAVGALWSLVTPELNLNVVRFAAGDGVAEHTNDEVDVIGVVLSGEGSAVIDGREEQLEAGRLLYMPKGSRRAIRAGRGDLVYLTCHRRRTGLMPRRARREER